MRGCLRYDLYIDKAILGFNAQVFDTEDAVYDAVFESEDLLELVEHTLPLFWLNVTFEKGADPSSVDEVEKTFSLHLTGSAEQ